MIIKMKILYVRLDHVQLEIFIYKIKFKIDKNKFRIRKFIDFIYLLKYFIYYLIVVHDESYFKLNLKLLLQEYYCTKNCFFLIFLCLL